MAATTQDAVQPPTCVATAVARLLMPDIKVRASAAANSRQLEQRFNYLWHAAHGILPTNALLAHQMISSMMDMARANRVELPPAVLDFICECCGALLVPSLSADVRVQPQTHKSRANRKLTRERRKTVAQLGTPSVPQMLLNVVRVSCHRCKHITDRAGASEIVKPKSKKRVTETLATAELASQPKRAKTAEQSSAASSTGPTDAAPAAGITSAPGAVVVVVATAAATTGALVVDAPLPEPAAPAPRSMFAPPPSPPRKLLDGPKRKKKKKAPDAAATAAKSSLSAFLQSLRPGTSK